MLTFLGEAFALDRKIYRQTGRAKFTVFQSLIIVATLHGTVQMLGIRINPANFIQQSSLLSFREN
jgi:hypothetical protein